MNQFTQDQIRNAVESAVEKYCRRLHIVGFDVDGCTVSVDIQVEPEKRKTVMIVEPEQIRTMRFTLDEGGTVFYNPGSAENGQSLYDQSRQIMAFRCFISEIMKQLSGNEERKGTAT